MSKMTEQEVLNRFQEIIENVFNETNASRTTLRIDMPEHGCHVNGAVAEAVAPGVNCIKTETSLQQRKAATAIWLEENRRVLVQDDCLSGELRPPIELVNAYGVKAQMLGPIEWKGDLIGWVSVHYIPSTRKWSEHDVQAIKNSCDSVLELLKNADWLKE